MRDYLSYHGFFSPFDKKGRSRNIKFIQLTHEADRTTGIAKYSSFEFLPDVEIPILVTSVFRYFFHLHSVRKRKP